MNPREIQKLMKQMNVDEIQADEVVIYAPNKEIVFDHPKVTKMTMMGQETYQIIGTPFEREAAAEEAEPEDADIEMVMEKTGTDLESAQKALEEADGDIAQAIINLTH